MRTIEKYCNTIGYDSETLGVLNKQQILWPFHLTKNLYVSSSSLMKWPRSKSGSGFTENGFKKKYFSFFLGGGQKRKRGRQAEEADGSPAKQKKGIPPAVEQQHSVLKWTGGCGSKHGKFYENSFSSTTVKKKTDELLTWFHSSVCEMLTVLLDKSGGGDDCHSLQANCSGPVANVDRSRSSNIS